MLLENNENLERKTKKRFDLFNIKRNAIILAIILIGSFSVLYFVFKINLVISIIISFSIIILIVIILVILFMKRLEKAGLSESWNDLYGQKKLNIPYFKNNLIINTFKLNGANYKEEIGEVHNGIDYQKSDRNYYDLFIPYSSLKNKNGINRIMLFIHGGGWKHGSRDTAHFLCFRYAKYGYITASMSHTFLNNKNNESSVFRILDEINACIADIKQQLKNEGFSQNDNKYEMAIGGLSSGGHLALLYGLSIKQSPIPVKFIIDFVGPVTLEPEYWYKKKDDHLDNIEPIDIENAISENKIIRIFTDESECLQYMNSFIGNKYKDNDIKEMMAGKTIDINNEKYKELYKVAKYGFPVFHLNENSIPILCIYGGEDSLVGVAHYSCLKKFSKGNKIELIYMKDSGHLMDNYETEEGMTAIREIHYQILNFAKKYFTKDENEIENENENELIIHT